MCAQMASTGDPGRQAWRNGQALAPAAGQPAGKALLPANGPITAHASCGDRVHLDDRPAAFYLPRAGRPGTSACGPSSTARTRMPNFEYEASDTNNSEPCEVSSIQPTLSVFRFIPLHLHEGYNRNNPSATFFPSPITFGTVSGWDISYDVFRLHPVAEMYVQLAGRSISPSFHFLGDESGSSTTRTNRANRSISWSGIDTGEHMPRGTSAWSRLSSTSRTPACPTSARAFLR